MIKSLHTLLFLLLAGMAVQAQRKCASYEHLMQQMAADPSRAARMNEIETFTQSHHDLNTAQRGTPVYNIPVVVHVLWNTSTQNISDAQIQSQIDVLNRDYQLLNSDSSLVPT